MGNLPLLMAAFIGFLEGIALTNLVLALVKKKLELKKILMIAFIIGISIQLIRLMSITFGVHTTVNIALMIFLINFLTKADLTAVVVATLISFIMLILVETAVIGMTLLVLQISMDIYLQDSLLRFMVALMHIFILYLISLIMRKYRERGKSNELFKS